MPLTGVLILLEAGSYPNVLQLSCILIAWRLCLRLPDCHVYAQWP